MFFLHRHSSCACVASAWCHISKPKKPRSARHSMLLSNAPSTSLANVFSPVA